MRSDFSSNIQKSFLILKFNSENTRPEEGFSSILCVGSNLVKLNSSLGDNTSSKHYGMLRGKSMKPAASSEKTLPAARGLLSAPKLYRGVYILTSLHRTIMFIGEHLHVFLHASYRRDVESLHVV